MIAISKNDFNKCGCVSCGCAQAISNGPKNDKTEYVHCLECGKEFVILADGVNRADLAWAIFIPGTYEILKYEYPDLMVHPREGMTKHRFKMTDIRPKEEGYDYLDPRIENNHMICFVRSTAAAKRVIDLFSSSSNFKCERFQPYNFLNWPQVVIESNDMMKLEYLRKIIESHSGTISQNLVDDADKMSRSFGNDWQYGNIQRFVNGYQYYSYSIALLNDPKLSSSAAVKEYYEQGRDINIILSYESFAVSKQISYLLSIGDEQSAKQLFSDFVDHSLAQYSCSMMNDYDIKLRDLGLLYTYEMHIHGKGLELLGETRPKVLDDLEINRLTNMINLLLSHLASGVDFDYVLSTIKSKEIKEVNIPMVINCGLYFQIKRYVEQNRLTDLISLLNYYRHTLNNQNDANNELLKLIDQILEKFGEPTLGINLMRTAK